jgi:hypothetical protein
MKIKLKGPLPERLRDYGLKPGIVYNAKPGEVGKGTSVIILVEFEDEVHNVTVTKENYCRV